MPKHVFKSISLKDLGKPIPITVAPIEGTEPKKELEDAEDIAINISVEEVEAELEEKRKQVEQEIIEKREKFKEEVEDTKQEAENWAFNKVKEANEQFESKINEAESIAQQKIAEAETEAEKIIQRANQEAAKKEDEAYRQGFERGQEEGYNVGKDEVDRLIARLNVILSTAIKKRNEIIDESEAQIIDIVIIMARKVVKSISETQKRVVYDNITEALKKLKGRSEITIRVNTEDLQMTTKHKKEFIQMVEGIEQIRILEDNTVEKGGCYISTDFGSIDAKISTQLSEIEEQIRKISPLKEEL